jgi:hypothetical protein
MESTPISAVTAGLAFPDRKFLMGPVTRAHLRRFLTHYAVIATAGLVMAGFGGSGASQRLGLGMVFPGGGFLPELGVSNGMGMLHLVLLACH